MCSHSLIIANVKFTDFNHLFSNIGYIFFGILFILITYKRERAYVPIKVRHLNFNIYKLQIKFFLFQNLTYLTFSIMVFLVIAVCIIQWDQH